MQYIAKIKPAASYFIFTEQHWLNFADFWLF